MLTALVERERVKCHQYWPHLYETTDFGKWRLYHRDSARLVKNLDLHSKDCRSEPPGGGGGCLFGIDLQASHSKLLVSVRIITVKNGGPN